jgi:hypothetical protein
MATTLEEWLAVVGKTYEDPVVQDLRLRHGLTGKGPKVAAFGDEPFPSAGLNLMLVKGAVNGKPSKGIYGITFYSKPKGERVPYSEALPHGLRWDESQAAVHARLGAPKTTAQLVKSDGYVFGDYSLSVEYEADGSRIKVVQIRLDRAGGSVAAAAK